MRVSISNRQDEVRLRARLLQRQLERALSLLPRPLPAGLKNLEVVLVDRATIARVHGSFLGDPTETDVITFPYGEIVVCAAVARDRAVDLGIEVEREVLLYALHGMLHLTGFDDTTLALRRVMTKAQDKLLDEVLAGPPGRTG